MIVNNYNSERKYRIQGLVSGILSPNHLFVPVDHCREDIRIDNRYRYSANIDYVSENDFEVSINLCAAAGFVRPSVDDLEVRPRW